jgi:hypothetical protein
MQTHVISPLITNNVAEQSPEMQFQVVDETFLNVFLF